MIKFRKNPIASETSEYAVLSGELISELVVRVLQTEGYDDNAFGSFQVLLNGTQLDQEFWAITKVNPSQEILICPIISRGDGAQLFKAIALIAITVVASVLLTPAGGATVASALSVAAVSVGASLLLNSLIPPPAMGGLGGLSSGLSDSQMYAISGQGNTTKKFGFVPKVYGRHKVYPTIAANPYTSIKSDTETGQLVQTFYCIYDFGYGPIQIEDIMIGDTPFNSYENAIYRLVDLKKPEVSEGPWDEVLYNSFQLYKGDVESDGTTVAIDKNQEDGAPTDDYSFTRNASDKIQDSDQEIILSFVAPNGLIAYGTDGSTVSRSITLDIQFSKVGEDDWHPFNDTNYVYDYDGQGGQSDEYYQSFVDAPGLVNVESDTTYDNLYTTTSAQYDEGPPPGYLYTYSTYFGYRAGRTYVTLKTGDINVANEIYAGGNLIGKVASIEASSVPGFSKYNLESPISTSIPLYRWVRRPYLGDERYMGLNGESPAPNPNQMITRRFGTTGVAVISGKSTAQVYATYSFKPREKAQYKVRVRRISSMSSKTFQVQDRLSLLSLTTRFDRSPILSEKRHVFMEVEIRATNQLNGSIQNLSAIATSVLPVWNGTAWVTQPTRNPAWVLADMLTGPINKRAISKDRLHLPSLLEWAEFCDEVPDSPPDYTYLEPRYQSDFVLDFQTTLQSLINNVTNACQSSLNIIDGKYGVLIDKKRVVPTQVFTPRNSHSFSSQRGYSDTPHCIKISFIDPDNSWNVTEVPIYDEGYDEETAERIDELTTFACTSYDQAWRFGRYMLAQAKLRRETISISVDFEHLACNRGDYVQVTQDVMRVGGTPARVTSVAGNIVTIDDGIETAGGVDYGYVFRSVSHGIYTNTLTVISSDTFELNGIKPNVGDLIIIGEVGKVVFDCIIKSIIPSSDIGATLTLVEKADGVYEVESTGVIPPYTPNLNTVIDSTTATPGPVQNLTVTANTWRVIGTSYQYHIDLDWDAPSNSAYANFEVYVDSGAGYNLWDITQETFYEYIVNPANLGVPHKFKVLAVSANGKKINLIESPEVIATPLPKTSRPSDVAGLFINITDQVISLDWDAVSDPDIREYLIRYSPKTENASWVSSVPLLRTDRNTTLASTQGRTGTYLIKAVDFNGNESLNAALAITSIPNLFDLNVIDETNDFPDLEGEMVNTEVEAGALILKKKNAGGIDTNEYYSFGYYYYKRFLDLGEIYTVRLQSLVEAQGYTVGDVMANWETLSAVERLFNAKQSEWDVETQYRATNTLNTMSDWATLSSIDPISEGSQDQWTPWRRFTIGDATGRIFQFRLKLISNMPTVSPRVFQGIIRADMPDRLESYTNLIVPEEGLFITYDPAFKGPGTTPNIQVTQDAAIAGDKMEITDRSLEGFQINFYDENNLPVSRQADISVKGYGRRATESI
jgi:predicted phage tail protein